MTSQPTKDSMRELVRACADAEYACGEWWGDEAKRGDFIAAQTRAEKARAALLSAIDSILDAEHRNFRFAMQCARYLTGEQIEAAAKTAGIDATICEISNDAESANRELVDNWKFVAAKWRSAAEQETPGVVTDTKRLDVMENLLREGGLTPIIALLVTEGGMYRSFREGADIEIARREGVST